MPLAVPILIWATQDPDDGVRSAAVRGLAKISDSRSIAALKAACLDSAWTIKSAAWDARAKLGLAPDTAEVIARISALTKGFSYEDAEWIQNMLSAVRRPADPALIDALEVVVDGEHYPPLAIAASLLGDIKGARVIDILKRLLYKGGEGAKRSVANALTQCGWQPSNDLDRVLLWGDEKRLENWATTKAALKTLGESKDPAFHHHAMTLLYTLGQEDAVPLMTQLLADFGTKKTATVLINSGHPLLEAAARSWGKRHGIPPKTVRGGQMKFGAK